MPSAFLDLGRTPLANSYVRPEKAEASDPLYPLAVAFCPRCYLVQLTHQVPPVELFSEYLYFSSYSESFLEHCRAMADELSRRFDLTENSRVLEVASNDGYLLQYFKRKGIQVLGVEPATNIAAEAAARGIPTLNRFFGTTAVSEVLAEFGPADLIIGNNVLAHVPEINGFLAAVGACLKLGGSAAFEFPYLGEFLRNVEFDTVYHEHVFYYSLNAIRALAERAGLEVFDVVPQKIHGGSLRVFLHHPGAHPIESSVSAMLDTEQKQGITSLSCYESFGRRVMSLKDKLLEMLGSFRKQGRRLAAYGAPAKGNTLLNYCGINTGLLEFTVDRSPHKQGLLLPGSRIPILAPQALLDKKPDFAIILPWNLKDEIVSQQQVYLRQGGRFIVPVPDPAIYPEGDPAR